jgi:hypothetical protein
MQLIPPKDGAITPSDEDLANVPAFPGEMDFFLVAQSTIDDAPRPLGNFLAVHHGRVEDIHFLDQMA